MTKRIKRTEDFEVSVEIKNDGFINAPRPEQRSWMINQALGEFAFELNAHDARAKNMLTGGSPTNVEGRKDAALTADEIMEDWQAPVMQAMADAVCAPGADILEVGFGRGVSSDMIQNGQVGSHTIIECNPHIVAECERWRTGYSASNIRIVQGLWEDTVEGLDAFDGIFFHTYPLSNEELLDNLAQCVTFAQPFFPSAAKLLKPGGKFSYYTNEADSLSRAHQRVLLDHFAAFTIRQVYGLDIPQDSHDAHWFTDMAIIEVTAN